MPPRCYGRRHWRTSRRGLYPAGPIPGGGIVSGDADIARAWLTAPTDRYPHGAFGDEFEAGALVAEDRDGARYIFRLDDASVFEDLTPRLADLDGDGYDEIWTMRSDFSEGARFKAYGVQDGALALRFATAPIGTGFRWLNPAGEAGFDGDGRREAAYVQTPHISAILTIVRAEERRLVPVARRPGYCNHAMGSTSLTLAAVAELNAETVNGADLILPLQNRRQFAVVSLTGGKLVQRWRSKPLPNITGGVRIAFNNGKSILHFDTASGPMRLQLPTL
ncbi:MAG: VCBS repeat-containing protein [Gammaproteobacteria bacterium]|nr:VCBS repeat-containing protein [Gammaproteobacteria bacterium]